MSDPFLPDAKWSLTSLCEQASALRSQAKGTTISFSPKVFIALTRLCRDSCGYCVFRQEPTPNKDCFMRPEEVLAVAHAGQQKGCREALFVLGERPEQRYPEARRWLREKGYDSTVDYLFQMCQMVLEETSLYPHHQCRNTLPFGARGAPTSERFARSHARNYQSSPIRTGRTSRFGSKQTSTCSHQHAASGG